MQSEIALLILKLHSQLLINLHSIKGAIKKTTPHHSIRR